jgi:hypothetical protein
MAFMFLFKADFLNPLSAIPMRQNQLSDWESTRWKAKILVGKVVQGFDNRSSQHLLGTHAIGTLFDGRTFLPLIQILKNPIANDRIGVNDVLMTSSSLLWRWSVIWGIRGICFCHFLRIL